MCTCGYLRVSSDAQTVESQRIGVLAYCEQNNMTIDKWVEEKVSGVKEVKKRKIGGILPNLKGGDTLIVAELSRLGRSVSMITVMIDKLYKRGIKIILVKQNIILEKKEGTVDNITSKMFIYLCSIFAEMERELIRARCMEGIRRVIAEGFDWGGRTRGKKYRSKRVRLHEDILSMRNAGYSVKRICKKLKLCNMTVYRSLKAEQGKIEGARA